MKNSIQLLFALILFFAFSSVMAQNKNSENSQKVIPVKTQNEPPTNTQIGNSSSNENRQPIRIANTSSGKSPRVMSSPKNAQNNTPQQSGMKMTRSNGKNASASSQQNAESSLEVGKK